MTHLRSQIKNLFLFIQAKEELDDNITLLKDRKATGSNSIPT